MNQKRARQIRKIVGYDPKEKDETLKRVYRRAKKAYTKLNNKPAKEFLSLLKDLYSSNQTKE